MERDGSAGKAEPFHQAGAREQSGAGAAARTGAQQGARGSHSGAWAGQPGEWAREAGAGWDGDWLGEARRRAGPWEGRPLAVVSLFDGCGAIWQALHDCGIPFTGVSSEIDPFAAEVVRHRWPAVQHVGDITALTPTTIHSALAAAAAAASCATAGATAGAGAAASAANTKELRPRKCKEASPNVPAGAHVDLLVGGFPCQDLSSMNRNRVGLHGPRSGLFFHLLRLIQQLSPRWFLVENVASMQWMDRDEISKYLGVPPICIDCADLTAQARRRLFWTNLPLPAQMPPVRCHPSTLLQSKLCDAIATEDKCGPIMKTNYRTAGKGRTNQVICLRSHAARFFLSHEIERIFGFPPGYTKIPAARFAAIKAGRRGATGGKAGAGKGQENGTGNWESAGADCLRVLNRAVFDGVREVREEEGEEAEVREVKEGEVRRVREVSACIAGGDGGKGGAEGFDVVGRDGGKWVSGVAGKACGERGKHKGGEARRWVEGKRNGVANGEREGGGGKRRRVWKGRDGGELQGAARCDAVRSGDCVDADGDEGDDGFDGYHGGAAANGASGLKSENAVKSGDVGVLKEDNAVENGHATDHEDSEDDVVEVPPSVLGDEKVGEKKGRREDGGGQAKASEHSSPAAGDGASAAAPAAAGGSTGRSLRARPGIGFYSEAELMRRGVQQQPQETRRRRSGASERASGRADGMSGREETCRWDESQQEELQERDRWGLLGNSFPVAVISYLLTPLLSPSLRLSAPPCGRDIIPAHAAAVPLAAPLRSSVCAACLCAAPCHPRQVRPHGAGGVRPHGAGGGERTSRVWAAYSWSKLPNWYALILSVEGGRFDTESLRKPTPLCITYRYFYLVDAQSAGHPANGKREEREESESGDEEEEEEEDEDEEGDEYKGEGEDEHTWHGAGLYEMEQETHTATSLTVFSHRVRRVRRVAGGAGRSVHAVYPQPGTVWALKWPFKRDFSLVYVVTSSIEFNPRSLSSPSPSSHPSPTTSPSLQPSPTPSRAPPASPTASRASIRAFSATVRALVRRRSVKVGVGMDPLWGVHEHEWQVDDLSAFAFEAPFHFHSDRHTLVVEPQTHKEPE
ncbi:unnamed protein product [Closterium sp. NIES-64]|nr:unnamed protein product [Closterium sp. NIES-64]